MKYSGRHAGLFAVFAALVAALGPARAEITTGQVDRLIEARELAVLSRTEDTIIVRAPTGDQVAIGLIDELGDGRKSILAFLAVYQNSGALPPAAFNAWNARATYKGFLMEDKAGLLQVNIAIGTLPEETIDAAWELFLAETQNFRRFLYGGSLMNSAALIGTGPSGRARHDAGMSRAEVTARDEAMTAALNRAPAGSVREVTEGLSLTDAQRELFAADSPLGVNRLR